MTGEEGSNSARQLVAGPFVGRGTFRTLVQLALAEAAQANWRELLVFDADFADWPLGESAVVESLSVWIRGAERFTMLACRYDQVERWHPLFVNWRRQWSHKVVCRAITTVPGLDVPSFLWSPQWVIERLGLRSFGGMCTNDAEQRHLVRQTADEWLQRSRPGFPAHPLGL